MEFDPNSMVIKTEIPKNSSALVDIAPVNQDSQSIWLMLAQDGGLLRFNAHSRRSELIGRIQLPSESAREPFAGHTLTRRLHISHNGEFVVVVFVFGFFCLFFVFCSGFF